jgi:hypothetical protein
MRCLHFFGSSAWLSAAPVEVCGAPVEHWWNAVALVCRGKHLLSWNVRMGHRGSPLLRSNSWQLLAMAMITGMPRGLALCRCLHLHLLLLQ